MATFSLWLLLAFVLTYQASALEFPEVSDIFVAFDYGDGRRLSRSVNAEDVGKLRAKRQCLTYPFCGRPVLPRINKGSSDGYSGMIYPGAPFIGTGGGSTLDSAYFFPIGRARDGILPGLYSEDQHVNTGMIYPGGPYIGGGGAFGQDGFHALPGSIYDYYPYPGLSRSLGGAGRRSASASAAASASASSSGRGSSAISTALATAAAGRRLLASPAVPAK